MITSSILDGKIHYKKQFALDLKFSSTRNDNDCTVEIVIDDDVILSKQLSTEVTEFRHMVSDDPGEHELKIVLKGQPRGTMLHIHYIRIEGLNMRLTMEDSGFCVMDDTQHIPSEYMGQVGYQSLKFTTPIYPWLLNNERKPTYYL